MNSKGHNLNILKNFFISRFVKKKPFILSHLITKRCNCDCPFCLWKEAPDSLTDELSTDQVKKLYQEIKENGFSGVVIWGGEPFIREDLGEVLEFARRINLFTLVITNGYFLPERLHILTWVDFLLVSIDAPTSLNDKIRGLPKVFNKALTGINKAKSRFPKLKIMIISLLSKLNQNQIEDMIKFSKELGVPIIFQSMNTSDPGLLNTTENFESLVLNLQEEQEIFTMIKNYKKRGYPIANSYGYIDFFRRQNRIYRCHYKKIIFRVEPNGDVLDCTQTGKVIGNVRKIPLVDFFKRDDFKSFLKIAQRCNRCVDAGVVESSFLWGLKAESILNTLQSLLQ